MYFGLDSRTTPTSLILNYDNLFLVELKLGMFKQTCTRLSAPFPSLISYFCAKKMSSDSDIFYWKLVI